MYLQILTSRGQDIHSSGVLRVGRGYLMVLSAPVLVLLYSPYMDTKVWAEPDRQHTGPMPCLVSSGKRKKGNINRGVRN